MVRSGGGGGVRWRRRCGRSGRGGGGVRMERSGVRMERSGGRGGVKRDSDSAMKEIYLHYVCSRCAMKSP